MKFRNLIIMLGLLLALVVLLASCETPQEPNDEIPAGIIGDTTLSPEISIVDLDTGDAYVNGTVNNVNAHSTNVVIYAWTNRWYVQPYVISPFTTIADDGTWRSYTHPWTQITALLVNQSYVPADILDTDPALGAHVLAWDKYPVPTVGAISITSTPPGANIWLNEDSTGHITPFTLGNLQAGVYNVRLTLAGFNHWSSAASVVAGETTNVTATLTSLPQPTLIAVASSPPHASIWFDGNSTALFTPDTIRDVSPGTHTITLRLPGYDDWTNSVYALFGHTEDVTATLNPRCPGEIVGDTNLEPYIRIDAIEVNTSPIHGRAYNINAQDIRVVLWAKTDRWYIQPYINSPYTNVCGDSTWSNGTHPWARMVALLVNTSYVTGATRDYHPSLDPGVIAWDEIPTPQPDRQIDWQSYTWMVKKAIEYQAGPGPNYFSDSDSSVFIDEQNQLHLKVVTANDHYYCAEVYLDQALGFGTYEFRLNSRVDNLETNTVAAGFTYEGPGREIDVEFSPSLIPSPNSGQFVVQPWNNAGNIHQFPMATQAQTSHRFEWQANSIHFTSWLGHGAYPPQPSDVINDWTYTGTDVPPADGAERMHFNVWLFNGATPAYGEEMIISSFQYQP